MQTPGRGIWFVALTLALALGTYAFDWLAVPVIAAAFTWVRKDDATGPTLAALAGMLAWIILLVVQSLAGNVMEVARVVGSAMGVGRGALLALTVAFPALLAGSAAGVVRGVAGRRIG